MTLKIKTMYKQTGYCEKCNYTGFLEIDPLSPEEADTPKHIFCDCVPDEWDLADESGAGEGER